ncbi:MAG: adenylate/guanylate cyclase domain-containing protein [Gammaproteobacteria bacterium]|nr:adenylate/guanylate cyclase domain-containing protein [Gammaproteobacteria bacterium]
MKHLPETIVEKLFDLILQQRPLAFLKMDLDSTLISAGGQLETFGLSELKEGVSVRNQVDILTGLLEPENLPIDLPFLETPSGAIADVYLFLKHDLIWVLFLDAEEKQKNQRAVRQKVNDLRLTHHRQSRILNQYLGKEVAERLEEGLENIEKSGERRNLTVMFADIRNFTSFSENTCPDKVFSVLNVYLSTMIPIVLSRRGVLDKIIGDEVMAIFGMLPDETEGPNQAYEAAVNMLLAIENLNRQRQQDGEPLLQIGIGMATGPVSLGVLGSQHRKSITVIGNHVNLAARLQGQAAPRQLIIDETTYRAISRDKTSFTHQKLELKGYSSALDTYQLELSQLPKLEQLLARNR